MTSTQPITSDRLILFTCGSEQLQTSFATKLLHQFIRLKQRIEIALEVGQPNEHVGIVHSSTGNVVKTDRNPFSFPALLIPIPSRFGLGHHLGYQLELSLPALYLYGVEGVRDIRCIPSDPAGYRYPLAPEFLG